MRKKSIFVLMFLVAALVVNMPMAYYVNAITAPTDICANYETGVASYYSYECAKLPMANGKPFDPTRRTCASWFYEFGTVLSVQSLDTGLSTKVTVTDRGPNKRLVKEGRIIDLSMRAFEDICALEKGLTRVSVKVISRP